MSSTEAKKVIQRLKLLAQEDDRLSINELRVIVALERAVARIERSETLAEHLVFKGALLAAQLPNHNSDPFDRLLIAQAKIIGLPIVTVDAKFKAYDVSVVWGVQDPQIGNCYFVEK